MMYQLLQTLNKNVSSNKNRRIHSFVKIYIFAIEHYQIFAAKATGSATGR